MHGVVALGYNRSMIEQKKEGPAKRTKISPMDFIVSFLCPTILGKILILHFGINYATYPGRGYGTGLALSIAFTLTMIGRFLWKYRHYEDRPREEGPGA